jgi:hypothetical protein
MAIRNREQFQKVVDGVARELATSIHRPDASFVRTPLMYPSGATVVVKVDGGPDKYFVSDYGLGYEESEMMGAAGIFSRYARTVADQAGVGFDQHSFFVIEVSADQLVGAVATIANCSQEAVTISYYKFLERKTAAESVNLYEKLVGIFPRGSVAKNADIFGASHTPYNVAAIVKLERTIAVFDTAVPHHTSVSSVVMKFHDLARLEQPPKRIAVVRKKGPFKTYLGVLTQAGNVIETDVPDETYRKLAA